MTPERWRQIKTIAYAAMELEPERRTSFLDRECGADAELRRIVEDLVEEDQKPGGDIQSAIGALAAQVRGAMTHRESADQVGQAISHYHITEKLGAGGMGVVYKAEDTKLKRQVALKFLRSDVLEDEEHKERFLREAQAAAALDHPNVCTVYEIDEVDGQTFLSMAFLEGQTVKDKLKERPLKLDEALDIAIQTARGLQAAHEKGVVHRDIKGANLMVTPQGQVKIMDFGLAQLAEQLPTHQDGNDSRHSRLHVARASEAPTHRPPHRHLVAWGGDLRDGDGTLAV